MSCDWLTAIVLTYVIHDISYRPQRALDAIETAVGRPYNLLEKVRMNGAGSPKLFIVDASKDIRALIDFNADIKTANIELRPGGIIIHFQSRLNVYAFPIAYHHLTEYQNGTEWSFHGNGSFLKVVLKQGETPFRRFLHKMMELKAKHCGTSVDR